MGKINCKSDFDFCLYLKDIDGNIIGIPDFELVGKLYTSSKSNSLNFSFNGNSGNKNCIADGDRIRIICDNHRLAPGVLNIEVVAKLPKAMYPDGIQDVAVCQPLQIQLVHGISTTLTPEAQSIIFPFKKSEIPQAENKTLESTADFVFINGCEIKEVFKLNNGSNTDVYWIVVDSPESFTTGVCPDKYHPRLLADNSLGEICNFAAMKDLGVNSDDEYDIDVLLKACDYIHNALPAFNYYYGLYRLLVNIPDSEGIWLLCGTPEEREPLMYGFFYPKISNKVEAYFVSADIAESVLNYKVLANGYSKTIVPKDEIPEWAHGFHGYAFRVNAGIFNEYATKAMDFLASQSATMSLRESVQDNKGFKDILQRIRQSAKQANVSS